MDKGAFITVEGIDGSGKTTQIRLMVDYLRSRGMEVVLTREPGGTKISEKIRAIILDPEHQEMSAITEMLLYASARAQLVSEVVKPALGQGKVVVCDRFVDSSYAYQGFGRGIGLNIIAEVNRAALDGVTPDITFFFDIGPDLTSKRINPDEADRMEREKIEFHRKVYNGYKRLAMLYPERIKLIDGRRGIDEISGEVRHWIDTVLE